MLLGEDLVAPWNQVDWENDAAWPWHSAAQDSPAALYRLWHDAVARSRASVARAIAEGGLGERIKYGFGDDPDDALSLQRLLVDIMEEYARHTGHADLIRETIDGQVGEDPPGAVYPDEPPAPRVVVRCFTPDRGHGVARTFVTSARGCGIWLP